VITMGEAAKGLYGAWRLARGDPGGLAYFDTGIDGFWRSFNAAFFALPGFAALVLLAVADYPGEVNLPGVLLVETIAYVIDWFAFPLAAVYVCQWLGKRDAYFRLIVALNWAKVIEAAVMVPGALLASLAPGGVLTLIPIAIFVGVLFYHWYVIRVSLNTGAGEAIMVTVINLTISLITALWARTLLF